MWKEFKEFALKGNAVDLAIGVIIGAAFGAIVTSLVSDIMMPPIGKALGGVDFSNLFVVLGDGTYPSLAEAQKAGAATVNYGVFLNKLINFLIVAFVLFMVVKAMNRLKREAPAPAPAPTEKECPQCATSIPIAAMTGCAVSLHHAKPTPSVSFTAASSASKNAGPFAASAASLRSLRNCSSAAVVLRPSSPSIGLAS